MAQKNKNKSKKKKEHDKGALFIPAGLFIGMGLGFLYDKFVEGMFLGLGAGFIAFAIVQLFTKKK